MADKQHVAVDVSPLSNSQTSGIASYLLGLIEYLPEMASDMRFSWYYSAGWRAATRYPPVAVPRNRQIVPPIPPRFLQLGWRFLGQPSLRYLAGNPDVFHASHVWAPPLGRARGVTTIHDLTPIIMPEVHLSSQVGAHIRNLRFAIEVATGILVDSEATRRDLLNVAPEVEARTRVVQLAAAEEFRPVTDHEELETVLQRFDLSYQEYFLFTGTLEPRKNLPRLLEAFSALAKGNLVGVRLVLVGPPGWGELSVKDEIERLGISDRVSITGPLPRQDLRFLMAGALALVYPSLYEGFGIPPLEAMSCGTPVITSITSSLPEVVGDAALLVDPRQVDDIAGAMERLATDTALRQELTTRGLQRAGRFSWQETARQTADFYRWVVNQSAGGRN